MGFAAALHAGHFQEREHPQGSGFPDFGQQFGDGFDITDGCGAGPQEHFRAGKPGFRELRVAPFRLGAGDEFYPICKHSWRRELAGHVGVVQMAMSIDKTGQ